MSDTLVLAQPVRCAVYPTPEADPDSEPIGTDEIVPVYLLAISDHGYCLWIGNPVMGHPWGLPRSCVARIDVLGDEALVPSHDHVCRFPDGPEVGVL